jgi:Na+-translocating ferredoxin:NAD+ oxidoreductase RNF subunit RnfB
MRSISNPETQLPEVIDDKCTACGACVTACPKGIIELRKRTRRIGKSMFPVSTRIKELLPRELVMWDVLV